MDKFFNILKKGLVATIFVIFGFIATYVPIPHQNNIETADAAWANVAGQAAALIEQAATALATTASAASAIAIELKEFVLDGLAWVLVKGIISSIVADLTDWVNSGFEGRPMFVQDIQGFLLESADKAFGEYIDELGGPASFLCSPFRLDISLALELSYAQSRINRPNTCSLTGIIDNIEGFMEGTQGSFAQGGWNDWFDVVSQPEMYTPFGALLTAESVGQAQIVNARGEQLEQLKFGNGFLSSKECTPAVGDGGVTKEICKVVTPGKIIAEALSFNLDSGRQSLVAADEIDELVGALIGQVANKLFTGTVSLLGL